MFSYYGRKSKTAGLYPQPKYGKVIEPFAGAAAYSLNGDNWKNEVTIVDKYEVLINIWKYLQESQPEDILKLPDFNKGDKISSHSQLIKAERDLIGFCVNRGNTTPVRSASNYNSWDKDKVRIAEDLYKIRHWNIIHGSYRDLENEEATWFIDPPYQEMGKYYKHNGDSIDFYHLGKWCKEREGQVIVCENKGANWLPFEDLYDFRGIAKNNIESIYYQENGKKVEFKVN